MKRFLWLLIVAASGCAATSEPVVILPPPPAITVPDQTPASALPGPIVSVAKQYQQFARKEIEAVTAPGVTPDYIHAVQIADRIARRALGVLEVHGSRATAEELSRARWAVRKLADVLDNEP